MPSLTAPQITRIHALDADGKSAAVIASKLQISFTAVRRVLDGPPSGKPDRPASTPSIAPASTRRRIAKIDGPSPVDVHVGRQVRLYRTVSGLSQSQLGKAIGLTFQQVQKYERGSNRISARVLVRISEALGVPVTAFFAGLKGDPDPASQDVQLRREAIEVARAFERIADPELRRVLFDLFRRLGVAIAADKEPISP